MATTSRRTRHPLSRPGRPRDPSLDQAILDAALDGLADLGYDRLSMDEIAARAHTGKGALYRRWPSKSALVCAAVTAWREQAVPVSPPDTGSLKGDLDAIIAAIPGDYSRAARDQIAMLVGLAGAASRDPELRTALADNLLARPRRLLGDVLDGAVARGEIAADCDLELVPDIVIGLNILRIMLGEAPNREHVSRVLHTIIYPLVTSQPSR